MIEKRTDLVDPAVFREVAGYFATGVTVITTADDDGPAGTTASAVASLSMEPPMMLVCLNRSSATHDRVAASGRFGVNILSERQGQAALTFARKGPDKFAEIEWAPSVDGVPFIDGSLAQIACRVIDTVVGGTHTVFLGEVLVAVATDEEPLAYYRGGFGRFEHQAEEASYAALRRHVLERRTTPGHPLDIDALAGEFRVKPLFIARAVTRLITEGLLQSGDSAAPTVAPLTAEFFAGLVAAQAAIELGVIDLHVRQADPKQLAAISAAATTLRELAAEGPTEINALLAAVRGVHHAIVSLSPSRRLVGAFDELSTAALWSSLLTGSARLRMLDASNLIALAQAVAERDLGAARSAIDAHVAAVIEAAAAEIGARSGSV